MNPSVQAMWINAAKMREDRREVPLPAKNERSTPGEEMYANVRLKMKIKLHKSES
jgi:hypothetical protein